MSPYMEDNGGFIKTIFRKQASLNILSLMVSVVGPIICTALAGVFFGSDGLAIVALCAPLFFAASFFGFIIVGGAQIVASGFIAKDEPDNVNKVYSAAIGLTLAAAVLLCAAMLALRAPVLTFMAGEISAALSTYYAYFVLYAFVTMLAYVPLFFSKIVGRQDISLLLTGLMSVVSIGASLLLMELGMGIEALALGQAIGTAVGFAVSMVLLGKHFRFVFPRELYLAQIIKTGSPVGLTRLYILLTTLVLNALFLLLGGNAALAVWGVVSMLHRFISALIAGFSQTVVPLVGVFHTEQDNTSVRQTMKISLTYGNILIAAVGVALVLLRNPIGAAFGLEGDLPLFAQALPFYAAYVFLLFNTSLFSSYYNASRRLMAANFIPFFQEFALVAAGALLFGTLFGLGGIWAALPVSGLGTMLLLLLLLVFFKRRDGDLTIPLLLDRRPERDGKYISFSVDSKPEKASEAAAAISDFCDENGVSPRQTMQISMSIEEIITLIINNSSTADFSVSVRLFILDDRRILRIRNAGVPFDAIAYYRSTIADDIEKSLEVIGMKYIVESAQNIYYRQTFGVNSLVVVL